MLIAIITGSRADWNGLSMVAKALKKAGANVEVIAIGQHADVEGSLQVVIGDGFDPKLSRTNFRDDMAIGAGTAAISLASLLDASTPDMAVVLGDRFEILGAATAVAARGIPLAHIGGGDITEGSIDNKFRYAITALADLHFVTNEESKRRLFGVTPKYCVGNPALDRIAITPSMNRAMLFKRLGLKDNRRNILVAYHAATSEADPVMSCRAMLKVLHDIDDDETSFLVLGTNSDTGSAEISDQLKRFVDIAYSAVWHANLSPEDFYGCLSYFDCMVGNSSAGIIETARFGIPVVNIGDRQKGRPEPGNVFSCIDHPEAIRMTLEVALAGRIPGVIKNPYGDGHSAPRIAKIIMERINGDKGTETSSSKPESMADT